LYDIQIKFGVPRKLVRSIKTCLDDIQIKVRLGFYLSSTYRIEKSWIQRNTLSPLQLNFAQNMLLGNYRKLGRD
jgi:hypothetical protein